MSNSNTGGMILANYDAAGNQLIDNPETVFDGGVAPGQMSGNLRIAGPVMATEGGDFVMPDGVPLPAAGFPTRFSDSVRFYLPHPLYCFQDVAGTTPSVQDGPVGLWRDTLDRGNPAIQGTAGARPILRKGAKNLLTNSTMQGAVSGTPGTIPTGFGIIAPTGINRTITLVNEVVNGVSMPVLHVRFQGTSTAAGVSTIGVDFTLSTAIPAVAGMQFTSQVQARLVQGSLPAMVVPLRTMLVERSQAGSILITSDSPPLSLTSSYASYQISRTFTNADTRFVSAGNRMDITLGTVVDFTISIAAPMLESGTLTPSAYAATPNAATSNPNSSNGIGPWWLDFDGVQTRLEFAQPVVRGGEEAFTCVALEPYLRATDAVVSLGAPIWHGNSVANDRFVSVLTGVATNGTYITSMNTAGTGTATSAATPPVTIRSVHSGYVTSDNRLLARVNGVQRASASGAAIVAPAVINNSTIGAARRNNNPPDLFYRGDIYGMALGNVTPTETEALAVERFIAAASEITL